MNGVPPLSTGLPGLDALLGGGLNQRAMTLVIGSPGAGKTVLASQITFNAARQGLQTLVFTSYSEGNDQYIEHMNAFGFFDPSLLGDSVQLFSLQSQIKGEQSSPVSTITNAIRTTEAKVVLIDGFQGIAPLLPEGQSVRTLLATLAIQIRYLDATLLITIAGNARDWQLHEEMTVADVAIGLNYSVQGRRHQRLMEVVKQRGRAQLPGLHSYTIDPSGIQVFPRIEVYPPRESRPRTDTREAFGLPGLDELLRGGPNTGTTTLLAGAPGVGKTTLGLAWAVTQATTEAVSLFVTFGEYPEQLQHKATAFGIKLQDAIEDGTVRIVRISPAEFDPDRFAAIILKELAIAPTSRLIIDDISVLLHELGDRARDFLSSLNDILYGANITSLYLLEIPAFDGFRIELTNTPLAILGDNVLVVQQYEIAGELRRLLAVLRMRLSFFDRTLRELVLNEEGIRVLLPKESVIGVLKTGAQLSGGIAPSGINQLPEEE